MERVCRRCGRVYRGLVCHDCHPRREKAADKAEAVKAAQDASHNQRIDEMTGAAAPGGPE